MSEELDLNSAAEMLLSKSAPEQPEQGQAEEDEQADEPAHKPEVSEQEPDEEPETTDEEGEKAEDSEPEQPKAEIADDTPVKVKVNGEETEVPLSELRKGYMMSADYTRKTQEVAEARKQFISQAQQYESAVKQQTDELGFLAQTFMQRLVDSDSATDWNALRRENPAEFAARQQDMQRNKELLNRAYSAYQQSQQRQTQIQQQAMQQRVAEQSERLATLIPEWLDDGIAAKEKTEVAKYLVSLGVPEDEIGQMSDATTVAVSRKAMLWDRLQAEKAKAAEKQVKKVPKFTAPGARDPNANKTALQKAKERFRKTGSVEDAAASLLVKYG